MTVLAAAAIAFASGAVSHGSAEEGGAVTIGAFYLNDESATLSRLKLYDFFAVGRGISGLDYWTGRAPGRYSELHLKNPGDQDHEASFATKADGWRFGLTQNRIYHAPSQDASTRREYTNASFRTLPVDRARLSLDIGAWRREGSLDSNRPAGQTDRIYALGIQSPAGDVSAGIAAEVVRTRNGVDDKNADNVTAVLMIRPGSSFSVGMSASVFEARGANSELGISKLKNKAYSLDLASRLSCGGMMTGNLKHEEISSAQATSMKLDSDKFSLGLNGGKPSRYWSLQYSFIDRDTAGLQTTGQKINRFSAQLRAKISASPLRTNLRAGVTIESRETESALTGIAPLTSFKEQGAEKIDANLKATARFLRKGKADMYARYRGEDFTLPAGITIGALSSNERTFGLTARYPLGTAEAAYTYFNGRWERDMRIEWIASGTTDINTTPASDQSMHTIGLWWQRGSRTDMSITASAATSRSGGLVEAGRGREYDAQLTALHRFGGNRECGFTLRYNDYIDDLSSAKSETTMLAELSLTKRF